jgi:uncharacterized protein with ParB-like and HNH nuclease domain
MVDQSITDSKSKKSEIESYHIDYNLSLTPTQRLEQHQSALETVIELQKAHQKLYAKPKSTIKTPS